MEATLTEILDARERRVQKQQALLSQYGKPLLCFTMNIPGPVKQSRDIAIGFTVGDRLLRNLINRYPLLHREVSFENTGCEGYYVVDLPADALKRIAISVEDTEPIGRLFDMDVLDTDGRKLSREEMGLPRRKCLLCEQDASVCARSRAHGLEELLDRVRYLLWRCGSQWLTELIGAQAWLAINHEFAATPKPGLVDRNNCGSHRDMNIKHFFASSNGLRPSWERFAAAGLATRQLPPQETFQRIRLIGLEAEQAMYQATGGVNTHKGAIFTMGLLCAAAGRLSPTLWTPETLCNECAAMTEGLVAADFAGVTEENAKTVGERLYAQYGITGVRGQAEQGFPAVLQTGLPILRQGLSLGLSINDAGCATLLHLLTATDDTNLIHRSNRETQLQIREQVAALLQETPYPDQASLLQLDRDFIEKNLSPGGSADLLAATYFLHFLTA